MSENWESVGTIISIDGARIEVQLEEAPSMVRATPSGVVRVAPVDSLLATEAGSTRMLAVVQSSRVVEAAPVDTQWPTGGLGYRRICTAFVLGELDPAGNFRPGLRTFPALLSPVRMANQSEALALCGSVDGARIGTSDSLNGADVRLDVNALFGRHVAVLGTTGSGKSCTVTAIVDATLEKSWNGTRFIILDVNGEYARAFQADARSACNAAVIGPTLGGDDGLHVPIWLMNGEEIAALLAAQEGAQAPVLQAAVADARGASEAQHGDVAALARGVAEVFGTMRVISEATSGQPGGELNRQVGALDAWLAELEAGADQGCAKLAADLREALQAWKGLNVLGGFNLLTVTQKQGMRAMIDECLALLPPFRSGRSVDSPIPYDFDDLLHVYLPNRVASESTRDARIRQFLSTMIMRAERLRSDTKYDFITDATDGEDAFGDFLRLVLGVSGAPAAKVVIIDLSLVSSDVLEDVCSLIGRLLLDFHQRMEPRGLSPTVLVLEEAHRCAPKEPARPSQRRSTAVFERIAKEGRKFGLGLVVASQRPAELSPTVLSQCGTWFVHRLANEADIAMVRAASPEASRARLAALPSLPRASALVMGEAINVPCVVQIRDVPTPPKGDDPDFIARWQDWDAAGVLTEVGRVADGWAEKAPPEPEAGPVG